MVTERPSKDAIFHAATNLADPHEQQAYLDQACAHDPRLRQDIEDLLEQDRNAGSFLESPPPGLPATINDTPVEQPGTLIGPYKLLQQIGEGGMGVVYMAEQREPVKRRVALKIIKPGMDTRQVIARFEAERQALAMMDHPNIAKVLDAGATQSGRPYFVMELVNGLPVTEYCDLQHLAPLERLGLFVPICRAVQHAHQKGVIHRDIKPTNVLVALYDGKPVPKVIDFGVAKATGHSLTDKTMFTQLGQVIGTLEYMSPEQAERNQLDVDTRSDVYSLGVVLYELLTGETPFGRERLRTAGFDETLRIIREEEPTKPSVKIGGNQMLPSVAANRRVESVRLSTLIRGELDWVVMKSLEKDRGRRYESASKFAEDVEHYLNGEPVTAAAPSTAYRLRKFTRRHKGGILAAAAMFLLLVGGISATSWQAVVAMREKVQATQEKNRAVAAEAIAQLRLEESEKARAQSEQDRKVAIAAQERAVAARKEASDVSRSLCDLLIADGKYHESAQAIAAKDNILLGWAASDPRAAANWYKEKLASGGLTNGPDDKQHPTVFHHLMLGLLASDSEEDVNLYARSPKELRPERSRVNNLTDLLMSKYALKLVNHNDGIGVQTLLAATDGLVQQSTVHRTAIQFAISGKLDEGLRFLDQHMPPPWKPGQYPRQPYMNRDEHVSAMAASAAGLDVRGRLDWLIANSTSVSNHLLLAAKKIPMVKVDTTPTVTPVGLEYRPREDLVVSRMTMNQQEYHRVVLQQLYQHGPPDGTRVFLFLTPEDQNDFVTASGDCKLTSFTDSTGKNLIKGSPEPIYIDDGKDKGWFQFEGLRAIRSNGNVQGYKIDGLLPPSDGAQFVAAKGILGASIACRKQTVTTSSALVNEGAILKSHDIEFKIKQLKPSGFQRLGRSNEEFEQFQRDFPFQMQVTFVPTGNSKVLLTDPTINRAYIAWRFIDKSGRVHDLVGSCGASWKKHGVVNQGEIELAAKEPLTEGRLEVDFWTEFKTVNVPFEVKIELGGQAIEVKDYDQRIRDRMIENRNE